MKRAAWILTLALLAPLAQGAQAQTAQTVAPATATQTVAPAQVTQAAPATQTARALQPVDPDRLYRLTSQLRCLVCQNESLADSDASLAVDLRNLVRDHMAAGESDAQIKQFLVARYGNFVIYRPPVTGSTLLLWLGPLLLVGIGILALWRGMRGGAVGSEAGSEAGEVDDAGQNKHKESRQ
ncbi:cytochrome c-type biogenesis protein [Paraburkholderia denitrificans]|uniref:Cytochrome c-type biogenesis protein n=1 Tax=Paraburkholderia denitrificans TaxID=694025 RepID=A0ABW0JDE6_9BURK